jgi:hypothetical protein
MRQKRKFSVHLKNAQNKNRMGLKRPLFHRKGRKIRAAAEDIINRRRAKKTCFLLTGATGFLGIHLAEMLSEQGYTVIILAWPRDNSAPEERIKTLFDWLGNDEVPSCVHIVPGDLNRSDLGLSSSDYHRLALRVDEIIHCASDTSFSERKRPHIEKANVENLLHLLDFATKSRCCFFTLSVRPTQPEKDGVSVRKHWRIPGRFSMCMKKPSTGLKWRLQTAAGGKASA